MMSDARQDEITTLVREGGFVAIEALAARFRVTPQTIRRDVGRLSGLGLVRRVHGGVDRPSGNIAYAARLVLNRAAKERIARRVAAVIPDGASVSLGIGTTPEMVALALGDRSGLKVVTNNLNVATLLGDRAGMEVYLAGGRVAERGITGAAAAAHFAAFKVDFGIFGVGGVEEDGTLLDFDPDEVLARQAIAAHCRTRVLVLDASKFGRPATARGGRLEEADLIVTDQPPPPPWDALAAAAGLALRVAGEGAAP